MDNKSDFYRYFNLSNASKDFKKKTRNHTIIQNPSKGTKKINAPFYKF